MNLAQITDDNLIVHELGNEAPQDPESEHVSCEQAEHSTLKGAPTVE